MKKNIYINLVAKKQVCTSPNKPLKTAKIGILLVNLGTPDKATYKNVRLYLQQFLSDKRVIETKTIWEKIRWKIILNLFILMKRPIKLAKAYASIWDDNLNQSPLLTITSKQAELLNERFNKKSKNIIVDFAMRYANTNPSISIEKRLNGLISQNCRKILILPLYPQYSATTTASINDEVARVLQMVRHQPTIRTLDPYYAKDVYINAIVKSIKNTVKQLDFTAHNIIASYHGIPLSYHKLGDPYPCMCKTTTRLIGDRLNLKRTVLLTTFQSLFGKQQWVKPYTEKTIVELARSGQENLIMLSPAFASDCLETLEEIQVELKGKFYAAGGKNFAYIPCLNHSKIGIDMLESLIVEAMAGWITTERK